jgi:hypothetical protein
MTQVITTVFGKIPNYWILATFRCCIYALIVGWSTFKAGVNGFDNIQAMSSMQFWELMGDVLMSMAAIWMAFIDQTIAKTQDLSNLKIGDTQMFSRPIQVESEKKV